MKSFADMFKSAIEYWSPDHPQSPLGYTTDTFRNVKWTWNYSEAEEDGHEIHNLTPTCPDCSGNVAMYRNDNNLVAFCPKCDTILDSVIATEDGYKVAIRGMIYEELKLRFGLDL